MRRGRPAYPDILTPREWEVLSLLQEGLTNPQIAQRLGVTEGAAKFHVSQILAKLGVESRQEAAGYTAAPRRAWLLLPFLAFAQFWKPAVRKWWGLAAVTAAAVATMALIVLVGVSSVRGGGGGAAPSAASTLEQALGPDVPPAQPAAGRGPDAPLGSTCQVTFPPQFARTKSVIGGDVGMGRDPFCIAWTDLYQDETGFRVVVEHGGMGHAFQQFVYHLSANLTEVFPPTSDWPPSKESDVAVRVYAQRPGGEEVVDGFSLDVN